MKNDGEDMTSFASCISFLEITIVLALSHLLLLPTMAEGFTQPAPITTAGRLEHQRSVSPAIVVTRGDGSTEATAIVLVDPVTDFAHVIRAALASRHVVITVQMPDVALPAAFRAFLPTTQQLLDAGATHTLQMQHRDTFSTVQQLQILSREHKLHIAGIIPLSEVAVEVSDLMASCLGVSHNPLKLLTARRDKGLMKRAVQSAGLRVAKHARIGSVADLQHATISLPLSYPLVVKTPSGMSTTDVHICSDENEAIDALHSIVDKLGPDGRTVTMALVEEYIDGTEFAINLMAFGDGAHLLVTDMWSYRKTHKARYDSAEICDPADYPTLVSYARGVAKAVGICFGAAHVELKARRGSDVTWTEPTMIEVGARLSGGRKSIMAQSAIDRWDPFTSLIASHCGKQCHSTLGNTDYLTPNRFARHVFLPIKMAGKVKEVQLKTSALTTLHSSTIIVKVGDVVRQTTDILSCAGFVWMVGERDQVDKDTKKILSSFNLVIS